MSYHVEQNTQQRSVGIIIVVTFHLVMIWALANGLGQAITTFVTSDPVKVTAIDENVLPLSLEPIKPVIPVTKVVTTDTLPTVDIDQERPQLFKAPNEEITGRPASGMSKPTLKKATKPEYPTAAARLGEEGATGLNLYITPDGRVGEVQLLSSSGSVRLDDAAIRHAKRNWTFSACNEAGKAVGCWYKTKLVWRLEDATR